VDIAFCVLHLFLFFFAKARELFHFFLIFFAFGGRPVGKKSKQTRGNEPVDSGAALRLEFCRHLEHVKVEMVELL